MEHPIDTSMEMVQSVCPGLVQNACGVLFLSNEQISDKPLKIDLDIVPSKGIITIRIFGKDFWIKIKQYGEVLNAVFYMDYDFKLSMETCMWIYSYDMEICYIDMSGSSYVYYDRVGIEREFTIKNIINN